MAKQATKTSDRGWIAGIIVSTVVGAGVLAANSVVSCLPFGSPLTVIKNVPQPLGWITQVLAIDSWPTYEGWEIRWVVWAMAAAALVILAAATKGRQTEEVGGRVLWLLAGIGLILSVLVSVRAVFSAVPAIGLAWTWQLVLALVWMLAVCAWTIRLGVRGPARAAGLAMAGLSAISLLCCVQSDQSYPTWPSGNVLLQTTACLAGVFLLGTWACGRLAMTKRRGLLRDYAAAMLVAALLAIVVVVLWMAGRRAGMLGMAAGGAFIVIARWPVRAASRAALEHGAEPASRGWLPGRTWGLLGLVVPVLVVGALFMPRALSWGRWQSVAYRETVYRQTLCILGQDRQTPWLGIGPGHLAFALTARMRPLHAESPRVFNGQIADHAHSELLEAVAELGLPVGLLYLALPLGGLVGFGFAYRAASSAHGGFHGHKQRDHGTQNTRQETDNLAVLGAGAALAACLAAEATSVGMRHAGTAMLVWTLVGMGWACGARAGAFDRWTRWSHPIGRFWMRSQVRLIGLTAGIALSLLVLGLAWRSSQAAGHLYQAREVWNAKQYAQAAQLLETPAWVPAAGTWMAWKCLQGRAYYVLMQLEPAREQTYRAKALAELDRLLALCPGYVDAPIWQAKATGDWGKRKALCEEFLRQDPYDLQARLLLASVPGTAPVEQLKSLRMGIRNSCVEPKLVNMFMQTLEDAAAQQQMMRWLADAQLAVQQPDPARWGDPLSLETLRLAVVAAGQQGQVGQACELANQAAALAEYLSTDPWRDRLETVQTEVYLDQAWFGWQLQPETARSCLDALQSRMRELGELPAETASQRMAAQFMAMLWLSQDNLEQAGRTLYRANPAIQQAALQQMIGLACARLVTQVGPRAPASQVDTWCNRGRQVLGEDLWLKAIGIAAARKGYPWWLGVLADE